jgi:hypothetical protein
MNTSLMMRVADELQKLKAWLCADTRVPYKKWIKSGAYVGVDLATEPDRTVTGGQTDQR